ncbi:MAG: DUF4097 domain-containing protein [Acidobacteria bacterium]|nr:DUF4097 domain-containing protein [Acidobacteriota bacterium]
MLRTAIFIVVAGVLLIPSCAAQARRGPGQSSPQKRAEAVLTVEPDIIVTLCAASGHITVRGWERKEIYAASLNGAHIELSRDGQASGTPLAAPHVQVIAHESVAKATATRLDRCRVFGNIELNVPQTATVWLKTRGGNISIDGLAHVRVETLSGTVDLRRIKSTTKVGSISGDVFLSDSTGEISINSSSGNIKVTSVSALTENDKFSAKSLSGDVSLEQISYQQVKAETVSGRMGLLGPISPSGHYDLKSTLGNVTLTLSGDASFQVNASVSQEGQIINDFPLHGGEIHTSSALRDLKGVYGNGGSLLVLSSFSGRVRLRRK